MSREFITSKFLEIADLKLSVLSMEKGNILIISKSDVLKIMQLSGRGFFIIPETTAEIIFGNDEKWDIFFFKGMEICVMRNSLVCPSADDVIPDDVILQPMIASATGASENATGYHVPDYIANYGKGKGKRKPRTMPVADVIINNGIIPPELQAEAISEDFQGRNGDEVKLCGNCIDLKQVCGQERLAQVSKQDFCDDWKERTVKHE